ncbi:LamG-like jellyroll fold domain-containing protein [Streptomyces sp. NPDC002088]|uniref:LamG-like jellyroll fold domain-containing protein n=1 Tax=Streptomyces sp. NPDC002088 TaxID=3154665 RepID=UPI0033336014
MRYSQATKRYQLAVTDRDSADATAVTPAGPPSMPSPNTENSGDHLTTLAYDAVFGEVKLYVNGQLSGIGTLWPNAWDLSSVSIQVGRSLTGTTGSEYFSGALDEVSACSELNGGPTCA